MVRRASLVPARSATWLLPALLLTSGAFAALAPTAAAHGDDSEEPYDPLAFDLLLFAASEGKLTEALPKAASLYFQAGEPNAPHPPLDFAFTSPARLSLETEVRVRLAYAMDKPMPPANADGDSFELTLLLGGAPTNATAKLKLPQTGFGLVGGGEPDVLEATVPLAGLRVGEGEGIGLRIRPLMPLIPPDSLRLLVGASAAAPMPPPGTTPGETEGTMIFFPFVRIPTVADLRLQDAGTEEFLLAADPGFRSGTATVYFELRVMHATAELGPLETPNGRKAYLLLRGVESSADAHAHHETLDPAQRAGAAHLYQVGDRLVRVHPGVGVRVPLQPGSDGLNVAVKCVASCPGGGFERTIPLLQPDDPEGATGGTLIPPPRSTKGIPVSEDAPQEGKKSFLPAPGPLLVAAAVAVAAGLTLSRPAKGKP